jgi:hypothetical protein
MIPRFKRLAPCLHYPGDDNSRYTRIGGTPRHLRLVPKCRQNLEARNLFLRPNGKIVVARLDLRQRVKAVHSRNTHHRPQQCQQQRENRFHITPLLTVSPVTRSPRVTLSLALPMSPPSTTNERVSPIPFHVVVWNPSRPWMRQARPMSFIPSPVTLPVPPTRRRSRPVPTQTYPSPGPGGISSVTNVRRDAGHLLLSSYPDEVVQATHSPAKTKAAIAKLAILVVAFSINHFRFNKLFRTSSLVRRRQAVGANGSVRYASRRGVIDHFVGWRQGIVHRIR